MALPELFGSYLLHYRLAEGSTSEVYLAQTTGDFPRLCAVKRLRPRLAALPEFAQRFREDAALLVRLIHGNLVQILEVGQTDEQPFVAMEQIDGVHLAELVATVTEHGPLPPEAALHIALELGEGVGYLARRRAEQADGGELSADRAWPLEVMVSFDGVVKIVDLGSFGALRIGQQSVQNIFQSPGYAVPEVIRKEPLDSRSDVFSVGLVLWELLAGKRLVADDPEGYVGAVLGGGWKAPMIDRKDVPGMVIRMVDQMLRLDPDQRPATLDEARPDLVAALRRLAASYGSSSLSWLLAERCAAKVSHLAELTTKVTRRAQTTHESGQVSTHTMTYGRAGAVDRPVIEPIKLSIGDRIPGTRYRLVRSIGSGGSAEVYSAQHIDLERQVAIKILDHELARQSSAIAQFRMEARACSRIGHPNIVDVIDFGELDDGRFFFAMELVEGESLADVLANERKMTPERALPIFRQVAKALGAAHEHHIIHRDMKPENIMLMKKDGRDDFVKVLDFGVMAFSSDTAADCVGTPGYMSPEQVDGALATPQMDIYALGATLYECLSGTLPYPGETLQEFAAQQAVGAPPALRELPGAKHIPPAIERVVNRALERSPSARQPSCADFEADLILAQREAELQTPWDDLPPPPAESLIDDRRGSLVLPGSGAAAPHPATPTQPRESDSAASMPPFRSAAMIWGVAGLVVIGGLVGMAITWPDRPDPVGNPIQADLRRSPLPNPPPADAGNQALPAALATLLAQAEKAADAGRFSQPRGESAYDRILAVEAARPQNRETPKLRQRFATTLAGMAKQLAERGFKGSARTLYGEALLFTPDSAELETLAAPPGKPPVKASRPEERNARIAHLLAQIDRAVAAGNLLKPAGQNALAYLWKLKKLDPTGKGTERVQTLMAQKVREKAEAAWSDPNRRPSARLLYVRLARLDPSDRLAKKRARGVRLPPTKGQPAAPVPLTGDAEKAKGLIREGNALLASGATVKARAKFAEARGVDPRSAEATAGLAETFLNGGEYIRAIELAGAAARQSRRNTRAQLVLGDASFQLGRKDQALAAWKRVLAIVPDHKGAKRRLARLQNK